MAVSPSADLQMGKTASTNTVKVGQQFNFTLYLTNAGPDTVTNIINITEVIPAGFQYVSNTATGPSGIYSFGQGRWMVAPGSPGWLSITIAVIATNAGVYTNTAVINVPPGLNDPNPGNNSASAVVTVAAGQADVSVLKTATPVFTNIGGQIQFTIQVKNNGPDSANNIVVRDYLPAGVTFVSSNVPPGTTYDPGTGTWNIPTLASNASLSLLLTAVNNNAAAVTNLAAIISSGSTDTNLANNTNSVVATWVSGPAADLVLGLSIITNVVKQYEQVLFSFTITNLGPATASNIQVRAQVPPGSVRSLISGSWNFDPVTGIWSRPGFVLPPNGDTFFQLYVIATNPGPLVMNGAIIASSPQDPNPANNTNSATVTVLPLFKLNGKVLQCATNGPPLEGALLTLTASNQPAQTVYSGTNGAYLFTNLLSGSYTITPSKDNYTFVPTNVVLNLTNNASVTTFVATARFISGTVFTGTNGSGLQGVTIRLTGAANATMQTDGSGQYLFTNLNAGTYVVTPLTNGFPFIKITPTNATLMLGSTTNCTNYANFFATNRVVVLRALEVIQAVQDWENSVPLVENKRTMVRAHLQLYGTNTQPVRVRDATLQLSQGRLSVILSPLNAPTGLLVVTNDAHPVRTNLSMSLNFEVPRAWRTGSNIQCTFQWTNGTLLVASNCPATNASTTVSFNPVPAIQVKWLFTRWTGTNGVVHGPATNRADELTSRLLSIYPVDRVDALAPAVYRWTNSPPRATNEPNTGVLDDLLDQLQSLRNTELGTNSKRHYYGVVTDVELGGLGFRPGDTSDGSLPDPAWIYGRNRHAHEIGHNLNRNHAVSYTGGGKRRGDCGETAPVAAPYFPYLWSSGGNNIPVLGPVDAGTNKFCYGWDSYAGIIVDPFKNYELMGYCGTWRWISKYTYTNVMNAIINRFSTNVAPGPAVAARIAGPGTAMDYLLVRGMIDLDTDLVSWRPFYPIHTSQPPPSPSGEYTLRLLNSVGAVVAELPFQPVQMEPDSPAGDTVRIALFTVPVPVVPDIQQAVILHNNIQIALRTGSAHAPVVQMLFPVGGEVFSSAPATASWLGYDQDGDPLTYLVQFSADGGASWQSLVTDWPATSLDLDMTLLPATSTGLIRVIASDGFHGAAAQSPGLFTVLNHTPAIAINRPVSNDLFIANQELIFQATANDLEDGPLDGTNIVWTSSRDGLLGTGAELVHLASDLSEGQHLITATAYDNSGATNSAFIAIRIMRDEPPVLSIRRTDPQAIISWPMSLTNYVLESTATLPAPSWLTVTNTPVITDVDQSVTVDANMGTKFFRLRRQP